MKVKIYRKIVTFISILIFLCLLAGCQSKKTTENNNNLHHDSELDSLPQNDPWIKYSYSERQGKILYDRYCVSCHGNQGAGDGFNAYTQNPPPKNLNNSSDSSSTEIIKKGGRGVNRSVLMPAYANTLPNEKISFLIDYIKTFSRKK